MGSESRFTRDTAVARDPETPGRYTATLSDDWNAPLIPQGGIATSIALRAMAEELDHPDQRLRTVTTAYAAQVAQGPAEVEVSVLRRGRSMSQAVATLRNLDAHAGHTSVAVFGARRHGYAFTDLAMPVVPPPEECRSWDDVPDDFEPEGPRRRPQTFWESVQSKVAVGHFPWDDYEPTSSERVYWYRFTEPPRRDDGMLDPLALVTLCDTMPGAVFERIGPGGPDWVPPSADLTVHLLGDADAEWLLARNRARHAGEGYASIDMELWDPGRGLVAYATQIMFFVFPDGPPS
jgi:acyl-CoA thioesterase